MTNIELRKIIIAQRKYYGEALTKLAEILRQNKLNDYADIAIHFKEHYGLEDGLVVNGEINNSKMLSRDELGNELSRILKLYHDLWMSANDIRIQMVGDFNDTDWRQAIKILYNQGLIDIRGTRTYTKYRWIAE